MNPHVESVTAPVAYYGCDSLGKLTSAMLHTPGKELRQINRYNYQQWLFDDVPDVDGFIDEHRQYKDLLASRGVQIHELSDYVVTHRDLMSRLPNLTYLHDIAVVSKEGAILSAMAFSGRKHEELVVREALTNMGIPIFYEFGSRSDAFEGLLLLSENSLLLAHTERHKAASIKKFIQKALESFEEIVYVRLPRERRYMHPDTIYNRVHHNLAVAYLPAFQHTYLITREENRKIDFLEHMKEQGIEIINVSDDEQRRLACTFVVLEPGVILHYDTALDKDTKVALARRGVDVTFFHPHALLAGGGSLRCMTLRIHREPVR